MYIGWGGIVINSSVKYRTNPNYVLRHIAGDAVLIPTGDTAVGNSMMEVNDTFCFLWELFSQSASINDAIQKANAQYVDPENQMETHIRAFVRDCLKFGMLLKEEN